MSFRTEILEQERILIFTECEDFDLAAEANDIVNSMLTTLDSVQESVVMIIDTRLHGMQNMSELMAVSTIVRSETGKRLVKHPKVIKMLVVTHSNLARMAMKGLNTATFGHIETIMYDTMEAALSDARAIIEAKEQVS